MLLNSFRKQHQTLSTDTSSIDEEKAKLKDYAKQIVAYDKQKKMLLDDREHQSVALALLQDSGIKSKIIKQYIPVINKLINKFLDKLDFFCQFHLDENFNESVKSRHRDEFSYNSFSEGQKLRIDLALIFTWREIARMKNSVTCNLVFFDEIFDSSLDGAGMDLALGLLDNMKDSNVFVVSHRDSNVDKYPNVIYIDMRNNFSYVKE
jgi:DNA repair exonuclease SbcCD ATPase subunit